MGNMVHISSATGGGSVCLQRSGIVSVLFTSLSSMRSPSRHKFHAYPLHLSFRDIYIGSLKSTAMGKFTPQKLANITNQGFFFFSWRAHY